MRSPFLIITMLLALSGSAALPGCNAHAVFEYDEDLCGNGQLDEQEPCDFDEEHGGVRFRDDSRCAENGYAGGLPSCVECRIIHEGSCIPKKACDAFQAEGCPDGDACYFFPESLSTGCAPVGGNLPGDPCADSSQCHPMSLCMDLPQRGKVCVQICDRMEPHCLGDTACLDADLPDPMGYCELSGIACDPITNLGCVEPEACYFFQSLEPQVQCTQRSGDDAVEDVGCGSSEQCSPTLTCVYDTCRVMCNTGTECAPGHMCNEGLGFLDFGVCPLGKSCDPVTGDGCGVWLACVFTDMPNGDRYCRMPGPLSEGTPCSSTTECGQGLFCSALQNSENPICLSLCSGRKTCYEGMACALGTDDFLPGLCVVPSSCDPLQPLDPGICSTPYACTVLNDQGELGCVTPGVVLEGEVCNLYQGCEPGYFCDNAGNGIRVCRRVCDLQTPDCPNGSCTTMNWAHTDLGVCK